MGAAVHRPASLDDVTQLFEVRRRSILELAPLGMSVGEAEAWAMRLTRAGMERKLRELEIWVAELDGVAAGWGAISGEHLEGLYTASEFAGRGVGTGLLAMLEGLMRERGVQAVRAEASSNAREFYLQRGYRTSGPQTANGAWPMTKSFNS
jgi:putative acetyltransferase